MSKPDPLPDPQAELLLLRRQVDRLQRRVAELQRFRDNVWRGAVEHLERWALHEGIAVPAPGPRPKSVPLSAEVHTALATPAAPPARPRTQRAPTTRRRPASRAVLRLERRSDPRYAVSRPVRFAAQGLERSVAATLVQVSDGAFVILTDHAPAPGTRAACGMYIGEKNALELVLAKGRVARLLSGPGPRGFVLRVHELTLPLQRLVDSLAGTVVIEASRPRADESTARVRRTPARSAR